MKCFANKFQLQ